MTRTLTAGMQTAIAAQTGELCHFIELNFSSGTTRITTAAVDLAWDSQTWLAVGGALSLGAVTESIDERTSGLDLQLSGVDQTILALILGAYFRGRQVKVWLAHYATDGTVIADPLQIFTGFSNSNWTIREKRDKATGEVRVDIQARMSSRLTELSQTRGIVTNVQSHQYHYSGDTFFQNVPGIVGKPIPWGVPSPYGPGSPPGGPVDPTGTYWP